MYNTILFDLDGTLTNPREGITKCIQYALFKMGINEPDLNKLLPFIGPPLVDAFSKYYGFDNENSLKAVAFYRERYTDIGIFENELIDGIPNMLENLKKAGKTIALATSKPHIFANRIIEHFDILKYFDIVVGAEFDGTRNEKQAVISEVLKNLPDNVSPIMVGDRKHDVIGAKLCSIPCVGVKFGYAEPFELENAGADFIAETVDDLYKILMK